jgi:SAM-dependent methyltransferase
VTESDRIAAAYEDLAVRAGSRWTPANRGNQSILAERRRMTRQLLERAGWVPLGNTRVLEVGSGGGGELAWLSEIGAEPANLVGVDLLPDRVAAAKRAHPDMEFHLGNAEHLEFPASSFDLVMAFTIFSSIFDESMSQNIAAEIVRVMRPGGALLWYDVRYDSPANKNVRGVKASRLRTLFPTLRGELVTITLLPPLARRLGPLTRAVYPVLARIPPLRSHLLGVLKKPA